MKEGKVMLILNLPNPQGMVVYRDFSGAYGTADLIKGNKHNKSEGIVFPVFMPYLATKVKSVGFDIRVIDAQVDNLNEKGIIDLIENRGEPDFIVSLISLPSIKEDVKILERIKEKFPKTKIIAVGTVCKFLSEEDILKKSRIDFLVKGNYPFYFNQIMELIGGGRKITEKEKLDDLDFEVYKLFPMRKYNVYLDDSSGKILSYFPIISSEGCRFSCIYCPYPSGFGVIHIYKSPEKLISEMEYLNKNFGISGFLFRDQVFTEDEDRIKRICELIEERKLNVRWVFETRVDRISKNLIKKMRRAGCNKIYFGVESGDPVMLKKIGKMGVTRDMIKEVFKNAKEEGIFTMAHVMIGLPGENEKTLKNTYKFLVELDPDSVSWNLVTPYPGTPLFTIAKRDELILTYDWERYNTEEVVMRTKELSADDLIRFKKEFERNFRIHKIIRRLENTPFSSRDRNFLIRGFIERVIKRVSQ